MTANSVIVWPLSSLIDARLSFMIIAFVWEGGGRALCGSEPTPVHLRFTGTCWVRPLRKEGSDLVDRTLDATGERGERCDGADRDHGQDDAVLGHRLTLLLAKQRQEITKIGKCQHSIHPLSLVSWGVQTDHAESVGS